MPCSDLIYDLAENTLQQTASKSALLVANAGLTAGFPTEGRGVWGATAFLLPFKPHCGASGTWGAECPQTWALGELAQAPRSELGVRRNPARRLTAHQGQAGRRAAHGLFGGPAPTLRAVPLRRVPGVTDGRSRLCCGPASLRLQHKTRGVGAAPGSRVVARGLTPCRGSPAGGARHASRWAAGCGVGTATC